MTCSRCRNADPNCYVCHDKPEEKEPEPLPGDPLEEALDQLISQNPETEQ